MSENSGEIEVPKISIILSARNEGERIDECLRALTEQTLKELEIICVNDGSEDDTLDKMNAWGEKDSRITVLSQENRGTCAGRNQGVEIAKGEYLCFCDGREVLNPETLQALYNCSSKGELDVLLFRQEAASEKSVPEENFEPEVLDGWTLFVRLMKNGLYSECSERLLLRRVYYLEEGLSFYEGILHGDYIFTFQSLSHGKRAAFGEGDFFQERPEATAEEYSFRDVYGLMTGLMTFETEMGTMHRAVEEEEAFTVLIDRLLAKARRMYYDLEESERKKISQLLPKERHFFRIWIEEYDRLTRSEQDLRKALTEQEMDHKEKLDQMQKEWDAEKAAVEEERRHARSEIDSQRGELRHLAAELRASSLEKQFLRDHCAELEAGRGAAGGRKHGASDNPSQEPTGLDGIEFPTVNEYDLTPGQYGGSLRNNWRASNHSVPEETEKKPEEKSEEKPSGQDLKGVWRIFRRFPRRNSEKKEEQ
ncbi:MAG: glycosyltransferase family 2 protein [Eubacteriales bacterium]|nr:glycosyltransferase family 2 protein [Eubacteriales bacterium]